MKQTDFHQTTVKGKVKAKAKVKYRMQIISHMISYDIISYHVAGFSCERRSTEVGQTTRTDRYNGTGESEEDQSSQGGDHVPRMEDET